MPEFKNEFVARGPGLGEAWHREMGRRIHMPEIRGVSDKQVAFAESRRKSALINATNQIANKAGPDRWMRQPKSVRDAFWNSLSKTAENTSAKFWIEQADADKIANDGFGAAGAARDRLVGRTFRYLLHRSNSEMAKAGGAKGAASSRAGSD